MIHKQLCAAQVPGLQFKTLQAKSECPVFCQGKKHCTFLLRALVTVTSGLGLQFPLNSGPHFAGYVLPALFHTTNPILPQGTKEKVIYNKLLQGPCFRKVNRREKIKIKPTTYPENCSSTKRLILPSRAELLGSPPARVRVPMGRSGFPRLSLCVLPPPGSDTQRTRCRCNKPAKRVFLSLSVQSLFWDLPISQLTQN